MLVYEIKSGNKKEELLEQMNKRCLFIHEYLKTIYNLPISYLGFYKKNRQNNIDSIESKQSENKMKNKFVYDEKNVPNKINAENHDENEDLEINKKENIGDNQENKNNGNFNFDNIINNDSGKINNNFNNKAENKENTKANNSNITINNSISSEYNEERAGGTIFNNNDKENNEDKNNEGTINNENKINEMSNDSDEKDYIILNRFPGKVIIFTLYDTIFGEKLKYNKEELNLLGALREDNNFIKSEIQILKNDIKDLKEDMKKNSLWMEGQIKLILKILNEKK